MLPRFGMGFRRRRSVFRPFSAVFVLFPILVVYPCDSAVADIVRMMDGRVVEGRIRSQNRKVLVIRTVRGTRRIPKRDVDEIIYRPFKFPRRKKSRAGKKTRPDEKSRTDKKPGRTRAAPKNPGANTGLPGIAKKTADPGPSDAREGGPWQRALGIMGRAALLPGWGHARGKRPDLARDVGLIFAAGGGLAWALNRHARQRREIFEQAGRESLNVALFLPANASLSADLDSSRPGNRAHRPLVEKGSPPGRRVRPGKRRGESFAGLLPGANISRRLAGTQARLRFCSGCFRVRFRPS